MPYNFQLLGTILVSVLDYDNLIKITEDPKVIDPKISVWVPADGRAIVGSQLTSRTAMKKAPDLRGKFIRGLNVIYSIGQPVPFDPSQLGDPEGANRVAGDYQPDGFKQHQHHYTHFDGGVVGDYSDDQDHRKASYGNMIGADTDKAGESKHETRVRNISVYYYIKIN